MSWDLEIEQLRRREAGAQAMGGAESVAFQHGRGKLTARERIALLADDGSFREFGGLQGRSEYGEDRGRVARLRHDADADL